MNNTNIGTESLEEVGLMATTSQEECPTITCDAFAGGLDFLGLFMQIVGAAIFAIILAIAFYVFQKQIERKNKK